MSFEILTTPRFDREFKALEKKYKSLREDLLKLKILLEKNPNTGVGLGSNIHKIRVSIKSKGTGKSGGGRVITYVIRDDHEIYLLSIYDKSEKVTMTDKEIKQLIKEINL